MFVYFMYYMCIFVFMLLSPQSTSILVLCKFKNWCNVKKCNKFIKKCRYFTSYKSPINTSSSMSLLSSSSSDWNNISISWFSNSSSSVFIISTESALSQFLWCFMYFSVTLLYASSSLFDIGFLSVLQQIK